MAEAPSFGQTIFQYDPTCRGAKDYAALADDVIAQWTGKQDATPDDTSSTPPDCSAEVIDHGAAEVPGAP